MNIKVIGLFISALLIGCAAKLYLNQHDDNHHTLRHQSKPSSSVTALPKNAELATLLFAKKPKEDQLTHNLFDQKDKRLRIVYFGFTRCPDVCPTSLAMLAGAFHQLTPQQLTQLRPVFISLDPNRDSLRNTAQYAHYFHPIIEGAAAPLTTTKPLADHYGVIFHKTILENSRLGYTLDHNSYFYLLKPDGQLIDKIPHTLSPQPIVQAIEQYLPPVPKA